MTSLQGPVILKCKEQITSKSKKMKSGNGKWYAVWRGRKPGLYHSWEECKAQIEGFAGAGYKSFGTMALARAAFLEKSGKGTTEQLKEAKIATLPPEITSAPGMLALTVDGACDDAGSGEFRGVLTPSMKQQFKFGPFSGATNNIMEFLAIVHGFQWIKARGMRIPLFSDSRTAISWVMTDGFCHTNSQLQPGSLIAEEVAKAEWWLQNDPFFCANSALLHKWDTRTYSEIPADFGRK